MTDHGETREELIRELTSLRERVAYLEDHASRKDKEEERYKALVESTDDSIYLIDSNSKYLFVNQKHLSRMGMPGGDIIGHHYGDFHSAEETTAFTGQVEEVFASGSSAQHEHESKRDGGYFLRTFSPVKESGGKTVAVIVVSKNITTLKKIEQERERLIAELRDALGKIRTLKGLIPVCAWCRKVRDDKGYWSEIETYIRGHSDADFTHGICEDCLQELMKQDEDGQEGER